MVNVAAARGANSLVKLKVEPTEIEKAFKKAEVFFSGFTTRVYNIAADLPNKTSVEERRERELQAIAKTIAVDVSFGIRHEASVVEECSKALKEALGKPVSKEELSDWALYAVCDEYVFPTITPEQIRAKENVPVTPQIKKDLIQAAKYMAAAERISKKAYELTYNNG